MAERLTGRRRVLVARSVHPEYRDVLKTYAKNSGLHVEEIGYAPNGTLDAKALQAALKEDVAEGVALCAARPPTEADIVDMEAQRFGLAPTYGGPFAGVIASRDKYVRQMPGRLAGQTTDTEGQRGFVLTLATREQHIRREKATSNICTNQALCALAATVH